MFLSVSAGPGRANGAIRRFLVGLPPGTPGGVSIPAVATASCPARSA